MTEQRRGNNPRRSVPLRVWGDYLLREPRLRYSSVIFRRQRMQKSVCHLRSVGSLRVLRGQSPSYMGIRYLQTSSQKHSFKTVFLERREKVKYVIQKFNIVNQDHEDVRAHSPRINIGDAHPHMLGCELFAGKLALNKKTPSADFDEHTGTGSAKPDTFDAKLTSKALFWGTNMLCIEDIVSVSYISGLRCFTVHSYPIKRMPSGISSILEAQRCRKDFHFLASTAEEAIHWIIGFAERQCFVNYEPSPTFKKQNYELSTRNYFYEQYHVKCRSPPKVLVILNPRSGYGSSSEVFNEKVEPIFQLAGFKMEVVQTTHAGHARAFVSSVDLSTCPDGIICVGGDGIINEVLNGLLARQNREEAILMPIGIIPAGSDNSLAFSVLGVRDPISAAMAIVKGGITTIDVLAKELIQTGAIHYGLTASYFGFLSDVLELSEKYLKRFGPLRYFVAGFLKFLCLPNYSFELEYLPVSSEDQLGLEEKDRANMSTFCTGKIRKNGEEPPGMPSLSRIDSVMAPDNFFAGDMDTAGRSNLVEEPEVHLSTAHNWPKNGSSSQPDEGLTRDYEPMRDVKPNGEADDQMYMQQSPDHLKVGAKSELASELEKKWIVRKGPLLGILVCNHFCKSSHSLRSQAVAPKAVHDDNSLDLLLIHGSGRLRLLRFLLLLQIGQHLSLPFVEYVKVRNVKIRSTNNSHDECGIDGELLHMNGQVKCSLLREQCRLIGLPIQDRA